MYISIILLTVSLFINPLYNSTMLKTCITAAEPMPHSTTIVQWVLLDVVTEYQKSQSIIIIMYPLSSLHIVALFINQDMA